LLFEAGLSEGASSSLQPVSIVAPVDRGPPTSARERAGRDLKTGVYQMNHNINTQQESSTSSTKRAFNLKTIRLEISEEHASALLKFSRSLQLKDLVTSIPEGESAEGILAAVDELAFALARDLRAQRG
jgi:hypothetical protein